MTKSKERLREFTDIYVEKILYGEEDTVNGACAVPSDNGSRAAAETISYIS